MSVLLGDLQVHRPSTIEEACALQDKLGDDAVFLAGGTELLLLMRLGLSHYEHLINLKYIPELRRLDVDDQGNLYIGGGVTHQELAESPVVHERVGEFARLERGVANLRVRISGTLAGNLAFADPHSDPATFLVAAGAKVVCASSGGARREIRAEDFIVDLYETALQPGEMISGVVLPAALAASGMSHQRFESQHQRPMVTVSCVVWFADAGTIASIGLAAGSLCPRPIRLDRAESLLSGVAVDAIDTRLLDQVADAAREEITTADDAGGSAEYKRHLLSVLVRRAVISAVGGADSRGSADR